MVRLSLSTLFVASSILTAYGGTVNVLPRAPVEKFDYVIVGGTYTLVMSIHSFFVTDGGAAGSIVASRLTEDPRTTVLLLEAGPTNEGLLVGEVPYIYARMFMSQYDYNYTLVPQASVDNRVLPYFRGRILGGSTSINGMTYTRGPKSDWDRIASYIGDPSWSWNALQPYFRKNEAFEDPPPASNGGPVGGRRQFTPSVHGRSGNIAVSLNEATEWIVPPTLEAAAAVGIPYNEDGNSGDPLGISWQQFSIKNGERSSVATGYLQTPSVKRRRNLVIRTDSHVTRILRKEGERGTRSVTFDRVEYVDQAGNTVVVQARKDIISSAGVIDTPTLLMRSGLGPQQELRDAGITPIADIPALGKNFVEHIGLPITWSVNTTLTDDELDRNTTLYGEELAKWEQTKSGRLTQTSLTHIMFDRVPQNESIWQDPSVAGQPDPSGGALAPHYEQIVSNKWTTLALLPPTGNYVGMTHFVTSPTSVGSVTLNASNPTGPPLINPNSLNTLWDRYVLRYAVRRTLAYMNADVWKKYDTTPQFELALDADDETADAFIRANAFGGAHGVATAKIGPRNSPAGSDVVGPDFRVKGVNGLRIVDASVIPFMPNGHSMAPVYIVAEKASDIIRWGR
ncbi:hypothetical protein EST38_g8376 [Candolleomyces aberdarensis]|uniref:pyranose dehydrogenase (acceptor) n=1 Tax=Candolleomyces aberdarensis TaxID=2316362 RepID=A0A4V1Q362_9AGAR|nr:hypothetical protein EST38_g8376 [Candolleomyces aberdarensis]